MLENALVESIAERKLITFGVVKCQGGGGGKHWRVTYAAENRCRLLGTNNYVPWHHFNFRPLGHICLTRHCAF
ncbi:hypothetical protein FKM82_005714 [Ascaphus truei]